MYGSWYPYVGQEAVSNGIVLTLNDDDWVTMTHRAQGSLVAKGGDLKKIAAEIWFRTTGSNGGYGGTMHVIQKDKGILGANGIVGGGWYMAAGAAYASLVKGTQQVAVAFAGDGASNSAYFFSAVRNATLYKVPALFVIENNLYASSTPISSTAPVKDLADYAKGLGLPCIVVDGNDIASVYSVAKAAVDRARAGQGPTVIEAKTYRWYDHYNFAGTKAGIDGAWGLPYRSDDELRAWMERDPIKLYKEFLIARQLASEADLAKIEAQEQATVEEAIAFAKASPHPEPEAGLSNVFANEAVVATQWYNGKGPVV
jgi:pyruvate dehydrogenase E1 component alpha subunit